MASSGSRRMRRGGADLRVDLLQGAEEGHKGRAAKVSDGAQAGEQAPVPHLLEVTLAHILHGHTHAHNEKLRYHKTVLAPTRRITLSNLVAQSIS